MINSVGASSKGEKAFPLTAICGGALSAHPLCVALTQKLRWPASFFRGTVGEALTLPINVVAWPNFFTKKTTINITNPQK